MTEPDTLPEPQAKKKPGVRHMIWVVLRAVLLVYLGLCLVLYLLQNRMVYIPRAEIEATPEAVGLPYEDLTLATDDGVRINAWFIPAAADKGTILFCHGNAGNISHRLVTIEQFNQLGYNILVFDYRGYGNSEGSPSEEGTYADAKAAWTWLTDTRGVAPDRIVVAGRSLGGAVAVWLATQVQPAALVLESTFTSLDDVAAELYWYLPVRLLSHFNYNSLERMSTVTCPVMVLHARGDVLVPFDHGRKLYDAAPEPKRFVELSGTHQNSFAVSSNYREELSVFLSTHLGRDVDNGAD